MNHRGRNTMIMVVAETERGLRILSEVKKDIDSPSMDPAVPCIIRLHVSMKRVVIPALTQVPRRIPASVMTLRVFPLP
jgi:hypothetical protein